MINLMLVIKQLKMLNNSSTNFTFLFSFSGRVPNGDHQFNCTYCCLSIYCLLGTSFKNLSLKLNISSYNNDLL